MSTYHIVNGTEMIGGVQPAEYRDPHAPAHWLIYFDVADCDKTIAKVQALGGHVHMAPMTMEKVGRFSVLADAQGAVFAIVQSLDGAEAKKPAAKVNSASKSQLAANKANTGAQKAKPTAKKTKPSKKAAPAKKAKAAKKTKPSKQTARAGHTRKPAKATKGRRTR